LTCKWVAQAGKLASLIASALACFRFANSRRSKARWRQLAEQ
jgi:hypothetical protein